MLENNVGSKFCLKTATVKNEEGARAIYMRVKVNRPRDTIPPQICHPSKWNVRAESEIKNKKASTEFRFRLIIILEPLHDNGQ